MKLLAYGVIPTTTEVGPDAPSGVGGNAVRCLWGEALGLVYSNAPDEPPADAASRCEAVVEYLHFRGTVLPYCRGCIVTSEADLYAILREYEDEYNALLDDLRDCEEMSVRIVWDEAAHDSLGGTLPDLSTIPDDSETSKSGIRSGMGRGARGSRKDPQTAQAEYVTKLCERFFTGLVRLIHAEWRATPDVELALQFLVERAKSSAFAARFEQFGETFAVRAQLAGPTPLYTFSVSTPLGCHPLPEPHS